MEMFPITQKSPFCVSLCTLLLPNKQLCMHNQLLQACLTLGLYELQPISLLCPWDFPGNSIGVDCHALFQGIFLTLGLNPQSPALQADSLPTEPPRETQYTALKGQSLSRVQLFCDPMDSSPPGSSDHRILQTTVLEWVTIPFSRGYPDRGIESRSPALQTDSLREAQKFEPKQQGLAVLVFPDPFIILQLIKGPYYTQTQHKA